MSLAALCERLPERRPRRGVLRQELARFLGAVQQHRNRLRNRHRLSARAVAVDDHRDLPVRVHREERRRFLLALGEVDGMEIVGEAAFLQPDARAHAVRGPGGIEIDHDFLAPVVCRKRNSKPNRRGGVAPGE